VLTRNNTGNNSNRKIKNFFQEPRIIARTGRRSPRGEGILATTKYHKVLTPDEFVLFSGYIRGSDWDQLMRLTGLNLANTQRKLYAITDTVWTAFVGDNLINGVLNAYG
jgi:hypothetical protein